MSSGAERRHIFISHHHADDQSVSDMTSLLKAKGYDIRNSSIRATAKPANQDRLDKGLIKTEVLQRLLRMKISWASTTVVLIGNETHSRPWVNWEIEQANKLGKRIVGVYERGNTEAKIPPALEKYASSIVNWNSESIMGALDGTANSFQNPDGSQRSPTHARVSVTC